MRSHEESMSTLGSSWEKLWFCLRNQKEIGRKVVKIESIRKCSSLFFNLHLKLFAVSISISNSLKGIIIDKNYIMYTELCFVFQNIYILIIWSQWLNYKYSISPHSIKQGHTQSLSQALNKLPLPSPSPELLVSLLLQRPWRALIARRMGKAVPVAPPQGGHRTSWWGRVLCKWQTWNSSMTSGVPSSRPQTLPQNGYAIFQNYA